MKVLHLCLANYFADGFSYQENMLSKYHKESGNDVEVIASTQTFDSSGKFTVYKGEHDYINEYGIPVHRLDYRGPDSVYRILRRYKGLRAALERFAPDCVFIHGCQFMDMDVVVKYIKKHPKTRVYVDNHADYNNSAKNFLSKNILHGVLWKRSAHIIEPYTSKFYGVVPARVEFLKEAYKLPAEKCSLLELGVDDSLAESALEPEVRENRRKDYGVEKEDFVIVTGGKIDRNKPQVLTLMKAVNQIDNGNIKLAVFGSVAPEYESEFESQLSDRVIFIGWRKSEEIYEDYAAADLVAFPGLHSVLWEQAAGMGKPCLFKRIKGFEHVDLGGNCLFFEKDDIEEYKRVIEQALRQIEPMKAAAQEKGPGRFSYKSIARRAIEL